MSAPALGWQSIIQQALGISPEDQKHIFDPYFRVISPDNTYLPNSTGLGLAIVHRVVKLLQGQISLHSQPHIGSVFTLTLPLEIQPTRA